MRRPATYFARLLNNLTSIYFSKTLIYIQNRLLFVTYVLYHTKSDRDVLKKIRGTSL